MLNLTIIIPNYNGKNLLAKYIPYVLESIAYANISYEFIIVDDCSTDDSVEFIKNQYPDIKLIRNSKNRGFAKTCNKGIAEAQGKYTLLLNSDVELTPEYIRKCLNAFKDANTFAVMGTIEEQNGTSQTTGILFKRSHFFIKKYANIESKETHFVSGANSIYDTAKLKQLKGFNTIFSPYYFEDDDLSYRAMLKGWKSYFLREAICYHQGSVSIKSCATKRKIKQTYFRNKMIFNFLHSKSSYAYFNTNNLILNIIPKFILGHFWILGSYYQYKRLIASSN